MINPKDSIEWSKADCLVCFVTKDLVEIPATNNLSGEKRDHTTPSLDIYSLTANS